jgi:hypothetical protein
MKDRLVDSNTTVSFNIKGAEGKKAAFYAGSLQSDPYSVNWNKEFATLTVKSSNLKLIITTLILLVSGGVAALYFLIKKKRKTEESKNNSDDANS